jgi:HEAT repeat protein
MSQVKSALEPEEPQYREAAKLGAEALPHLKKLVDDDDPLLASKATYLAGLIDAEGSGAIVALAAQSDQVTVRVAAANSAANVTDADSAVYEGLLADNDVGVRRAAVKSIGSSDRGDLKPLVQQMADADTAVSIRDLAATTARSLKKPK